MAARMRLRNGSLLILWLACGSAPKDWTAVDAAADAALDAGEPPTPDAGAPDLLLADVPLAVPSPSAPSFACGPARPLPAGPLCGPAGYPCVLLRDELIARRPSPAAASSLAVDRAGRPAVLLLGSLQAPPAYGVRDDDGRWTLEPLHGTLNSGSLAIDSEGTVHALGYDHARAVHLWRRSARGWDAVERVAATSINHGSLARDEAGCLHATLSGAPHDPEAVVYAQRKERWAIHTTLPHRSLGARPPVTLSPRGRVHLLLPHGNLLQWMAPPDPAEDVLRVDRDLGLQALDNLVMAVTDEGPIGRPHLLVAHTPDGAPELRRLAHATRAPGGWSLSTLAEGPRRSRCEATPVAGQSCPLDHVLFHPIAATAAGNGDVRLFYVREKHGGTMTAECHGQSLILAGAPDAAVPGCAWKGGSITRTLEVAWPDGATFRHAVVATLSPGLEPLAPASAQDGLGRLHLSWGTPEAVRYLLIGPGR